MLGVGCEINFNGSELDFEDEQRTHTLSDGRVVFPTEIEKGDIVAHLIALQEDRDYHIIVDSFGGNAFDSIAIMNRIAELRNKGFIITTEAYGYTLSGGVFIFIMGDIRIIHNGASIMFHGSGVNKYKKRDSLRTLVLTGKSDLEQHVIDSFQLIDNKYKKELLEQTLMTEEDIKKWMYTLNYNFMSAKEAIRLGIATELK